MPRAGLPVFWSQAHSENDAGRLGHRLRTHIDKGGVLPCVRAVAAAGFFRVLDALQLRLQAAGIGLPPEARR